MKLRKDKWQNIKLEELSYGIEYGITTSAEEIGNTIFLRITDINENGKLNNRLKYTTVNEKTFQKYKLHKNNILIARSGATAGKPYIHKSDNRFVFASYLLRVKLKEEIIYPDYFFSFLNSPSYNQQLNSIKVGSAQPNVNTKNLGSIKIPVPSLEEQQQIATLFQSLENAIEQVESQEKNLKTLQKELSNKLITTNPIFGNLLADKNCNLCTFEDITNCVEKHDKKPLENGINRFVGLEFIEAENFNLQGFGEIEKGTTFTKCFIKNDVLFGKRRAYLKKIAVADFDGICSGDILVFRAKKEKLLPELLPYYVSSEAFIQHAVNTSAGSLSPRTKWKDLKEFKVSIPNLETQKKIAEIFQQLQLILNQLKQQKLSLNNLKQKLLSEILG